MQATRDFIKRNRKNFAIGFGLVGSGYFATQYILGKLSETREKLAGERIAKENLRRRFEQNQEDCSFTVLALLPTATERILEVLPVEQITHQLQEKKAARLARSTGSIVSPSDVSVSAATSVKDDDGMSVKSFASESVAQGHGPDGEPRQPKKSKAQLWNELKLTSVTRAFTLIYTLALLCFLTRIQLNLLGRKNYLSSVVSLAERDNEPAISLETHDSQHGGDEYDVNRKYLTFSWWLLHRGWRKLLTIVETSVKQVFGPLNPRHDISMAQIRKLTMQVRETIEGNEDSSWLPFLLPPRGEEDMVLSEAGVLKSDDASDDEYQNIQNPLEESTDLEASQQQPPQPEEQQQQQKPEQEPKSRKRSASSATFATSQTLRHLLDETSDLIDSPPGRSVMTQMLDAGFDVLIEEKLAEQAFKVIGMVNRAEHRHKGNDEEREGKEGEIDEDKRIQELDEIHEKAITKVANVLAVLTRQAHLIGNGIPNEYLKAMERMKDLAGFSAVIYSNFELVKQPMAE